MKKNNIEQLTSQIENLKRAGKYAEARVILEQVVLELDENINPDEIKPPWYHHQLSIVLKKLGAKEEAKKRLDQADEIVIRNFINQSRVIYEMPIEIRSKYYPNGPIVSHKVIDAAARLQKSNPELVKLAGLL